MQGCTARVWPILLELKWEFLWLALAPKLESEICEILSKKIIFKNFQFGLFSTVQVGPGIKCRVATTN